MVSAYVSSSARKPTAGTVLQHCKKQVELFRASLGGAVAVFKIGYTSNPVRRFVSYHMHNFAAMRVIHTTENRGVAEMLEAALIDAFKQVRGCRNDKPGGEGPGHLIARNYYVYIVGARADEAKPIGG